EFTAVGKSANVVQLRIGRPRNGERNGFGPRRQQQRPEWEYLAALDLNLLLPHIKCGHSRAENEIDTLFSVVVRQPQWHPLVRNGTGKVILGNIRTVVGSEIIRANHRHKSIVT